MNDFNVNIGNNGNVNVDINRWYRGNLTSFGNNTGEGVVNINVPDWKQGTLAFGMSNVTMRVNANMYATGLTSGQMVSMGNNFFPESIFEFRGSVTTNSNHPVFNATSSGSQVRTYIDAQIRNLNATGSSAHGINLSSLSNPFILGPNTVIYTANPATYSIFTTVARNVRAYGNIFSNRNTGTAAVTFTTGSLTVDTDVI
jgi:hypothetical protein